MRLFVAIALALSSVACLSPVDEQGAKHECKASTDCGPGWTCLFVMDQAYVPGGEQCCVPVNPDAAVTNAAPGASGRKVSFPVTSCDNIPGRVPADTTVCLAGCDTDGGTR